MKNNTRFMAHTHISLSDFQLFSFCFFWSLNPILQMQPVFQPAFFAFNIDSIVLKDCLLNQNPTF